MSVPVARGPAPHGDEHMGTEVPDRPHEVGEDAFALPLGEGLFGGLGVAEVERAAEVLPRPVDGSGGQKFAGADDAEAFAEFRPDEVLAAFAPREREIGGLDAPAASERREERGVLVIGVGRDDEYPLHAVHLPAG